MLNKKKILIVLFGAISDVVRGLPVACKIKEAYPDCHLAWAVEPASRNIVVDHPCIDKIHLFERNKGFPAYLKLLKEIRAEKFDLVLDLHNHVKSGFTSFYTGAKRRIGFHPMSAREFNWIFNTEYIPRVEKNTMKIGHYMLFCKKLGLNTDGKYNFKLFTPEVDKVRVKRLFETELKAQGFKGGLEEFNRKKKIALILISTWISRNYPARECIEMLSELSEAGEFTAVLVDGKVPDQIANEIAAGVKTKCVLNLVNKLPLKQLPAVFEEMDAVVSVDTGPMHIAATTAAPIISIWGPTSPHRAAPYGNEKRIAINSELDCLACHRRACPRADRNNVCMRGHSGKIVTMLKELFGWG